MWDRNGSRSPDIPLFGEARPIDKVINLVVGALTIVVIGGTICISLYFAARREDALIKIIFFSINIILLLISHLVLIYWYREGDLDPKFRKLIIYNSAIIICLCILTNIMLNT